ncbi:sulfatase [Halosimplex salinum]|uniref:sulfatase n=1 Tax=Halosimplex salinum TaxID=1710538 RepID=UPI0022A71552|nr:sulfatase [Halosimplex salinum]
MKQNVVVVVMDTARYADVFPDDETVAPTLQSIAAEGTRFGHTFAPAPWTLPSHASLFTGTYPSKHGANADHKRLNDALPTLPEAFADAGYETVAVSNNTWISEEFGFARGFETFVKTWQYVQSDTDLGRVARTTEGTEMFRGLARALFDGNPLTNAANAVYGQFFRKREDSGARRTNEWIREWLGERDDDRPFFLFANYLEPHLEYRPPADVAERFLPDGVSYEEAMDISQDAWSYVAGDLDLDERELDALRGLYRGEIAYLDERIGELREMLADNDAWEDTVFVVTSDHGENIGDHGLMDHQYCLYDTLLHVPLVIHGGPFTDGSNDDTLVSLTDLAPTLLDAAGIEASALTEQTQGCSLLSASISEREQIFAEYLAPQPSMAALSERVGPLSDDVRRFDRSLRAVRTPGWKLIRGSDDSKERYDVASDPDESNDLTTAEPERVADLETRLDEWLDSFSHADGGGEASMSDATRQRLDDLGYLQE